jgi:hypothetical protein
MPSTAAARVTLLSRAMTAKARTELSGNDSCPSGKTGLFPEMTADHNRTYLVRIIR